MYIRSSYNAGTSPVFMAERLAAGTAKVGDARTLPGGQERGERIIDSLVQTTLGRQAGVKGYTAKAQYEQKIVDAIEAQIGRLPPSTSAKQRAAWDARLAEARGAVADSQSEIAFYQNNVDNDPMNETVLRTAARMMGVSVEQVHALYNERLAAAVSAASAAESAPVAPSTTPSGQREWGWDPSGLRAEIKVNGEVVGRIYNSGTVELADEYADFGLELGFGMPGEEGLFGPDLGEHRIAKLVKALGNARVEVITAATALTQAQWRAQMALGGLWIDKSA